MMARPRQSGNPMTACGRCLLLGAALALLAGCDEAPQATATERLDRPWEEIVAQARGATVHLAMWSGDAGYNRYIDDYAAPRLQRRYGIELRRVPLDGTEAVTSKLLAEKQADRRRGSIGLVWINGQTFATGAEADLWAEDWACELPNARYIDWQSPSINRDFGYPVDCREAPWSRAQLVMIYASTEVDEPPRTPAELARWIEAHPGRFTYPAPPDFTGTAFVEQLLVLLSGESFQRPFDEALFERSAPQLWRYLERIEAHLWREGATYPTSSQKLNELYANGEVSMTMSYNPQFAQRQVDKGLFPESTRTFVFDGGSIHNTSYLAMPFNAPRAAAAAVVANFLQSPRAQIAKQDPERLGALTVLDRRRLAPEQREALASLRGEASLSLETLASHRIPEPWHGWVQPVQQGWRRHVAED